MLGHIDRTLRGACDALVLVDARTFAIVEMDARAAALLGRDGTPSLELLCEASPAHDAEALRELCRAATRGETPSRAHRFTRPDGSALWLELRARAETLDGLHVVVLMGLDVTARKQEEAELRRSRAFFEAAIRQSGIGIVIMQAGEPNTTLANAAARDILGVPHVDEALPLTGAAKWPEIMRDGVAITSEQYPVVRAFEREELIVGEELEVIRDDGARRTILCSARPVYGEQGERLGSIVLFPDVTEWKRTEASVRERDRLLQIFHDQIRDAVYAVDATGRIDYVTPSLERMTGKACAALLGKTLEESGILAPKSLPGAREDLAHVLAGHPLAHRDYEYVSKSGEPRIGEVTGSPLLDDGGRPRALFLARDVTARREEAVLRAAREARVREAQKLEALGTLAKGVAHEMNNPLTGILNLAELIELDIVQPDGLKDVALRIKSLCERMGATVHNLLAFAASDSRTMAPVSLVDIVDATLELASPRLKRDRVMAQRVGPQRALPEIEGRSSELQQLLLILLTNASDAVLALPDAPPERRTIEVRIARAERDGQASVTLSVADQGIGMADDIAYRVFDPFYTTKPPDKGAGLGLWIAQGIARDHGGMLEFETKMGVGTTFRLTLPGAARVGDGL